MREHLLGYLIGALEPHEAEELESTLSQDDQLRRELDSLRHCLFPLAADHGHLDPPTGLALRTCQFISARTVSPVVPLAPASVRGWRLADMLVAACVLVAGALVLFPAVSYSRFQAQVAGCQNNLRQIGSGLGQFAQFHAGFFPKIAASGKDAVAGVQAAILREEGYVDREDAFFCPGPGRGDRRLATRADLLNANGEQLTAAQRALGGNYGYSLGYVDNGVLQAVRNRNRATFALVADTPNVNLATAQSASHGEWGQNVLFEGGNVKFLRTCESCPFTKDDLYHNEDGEMAAGKHADDAVIGPSEATPLGPNHVK